MSPIARAIAAAALLVVLSGGGAAVGLVEREWLLFGVSAYLLLGFIAMLYFLSIVARLRP